MNKYTDCDRVWLHRDIWVLCLFTVRNSPRTSGGLHDSRRYRKHRHGLGTGALRRVLRERKNGATADAPLRALSIQTGAYEAASIGNGIDSDKAAPRPIAHDLLLNTVKELGARVERVEINRWDAPVFYADIVLECTGNAAESKVSEQGDGVREIKLDARPSDALALATRSNAPIYVEDDVMNRAGSISYQAARDEQSSQEEIERFDEFVKNLSPDDF